MSRHPLNPLWLPGGHLQTIFPLLRKGPCPPYQRERITTPDGDFIDLDWIDTKPREAPLLVLFHGLEGSSRSHYARHLVRAAGARGWNAVVPHFRGCSGEPNRLLRAYHSGDSEEIGWILGQLVLRTRQPVLVAGVSLGGNALLKWLGEQAHRIDSQIVAAAAICAPLDLTESGQALGRGFNRLYTRHFLRTLIVKARAKHLRHGGGFDLARTLAATSLFDFDDAYTGPVHGFAGALDYWRRASAKPFISAIELPTLLLNPLNDPFVPLQALPETHSLGPGVTLDTPAGGGHVGFISGAPPGDSDWLIRRVFGHFDAILGIPTQDVP